MVTATTKELQARSCHLFFPLVCLCVCVWLLHAWMGCYVFPKFSSFVHFSIFRKVTTRGLADDFFFSRFSFLFFSRKNIAFINERRFVQNEPRFNVLFCSKCDLLYVRGLIFVLSLRVATAAAAREEALGCFRAKAVTFDIGCFVIGKPFAVRCGILFFFVITSPNEMSKQIYSTLRKILMIINA